MGERDVALAVLEIYQARLRFVDVYDSLLERLTDALKEAVGWERNECAILADSMSSGDSWATAAQAATRIRERE